MNERPTIGIAADADDGRVAEAGVGQLLADLVRESARARDEADAALAEHLRRDDADVGDTRRERARAVGPEQRRAAGAHVTVELQHVVGGDALGDAHDRGHAGVDRLVDRVGGEARRHEHHRRVRGTLVDGVGHGVEDRDAVDVLAGLAGRDARDHSRAVVAVAQRVEAALAAGDALDDEAGVGADEDGHYDAAASSTTRSAAPSIVASTYRFGRRRFGQDPAALDVVRPVEPHDDRHAHVELLERRQDAAGDLVAAGDASEHVEEHRPHLRVGQEHLHRRHDLVRLGAAADVEEVGRTPARAGDDVERRHDEARAVAEDADGAVKLDVGDAVLVRHLPPARRAPPRRAWRRCRGA